MPVDQVAIVGAGTIGCSFAAVFARAGWGVRIFDASPASRAQALSRVAAFLEQTGDFSALVTVHDNLAEATDGVSWVQECVPERLDFKRAVFADLDEICSRDVILASSASALTMTAIAQGLRHPGRCVVVHPTNPPHLLRFIEVVAGVDTTPGVETRAVEVMRQVGQYAAVVQSEIPGFVLNRLQVALEREAFKLLAHGVASVRDIDAALVHGLAPRWAALGPFAVEETNSENITVGLTKFRDYFNETIAALDVEAFAMVDDQFTRMVADGVTSAYGPDSHDALMTRRDRMLLRLRSQPTVTD